MSTVPELPEGWTVRAQSQVRCRDGRKLGERWAYVIDAPDHVVHVSYYKYHSEASALEAGTKDAAACASLPPDLTP